MPTKNQYGQPIGDPVRPDRVPAAIPRARAIFGTHCRLEPLDPDRHARELHDAHSAAPDSRDWTYTSVEPFPSFESYYDWAVSAAASADPRHFSVIDNASGHALGTMALARHDPNNGVIEVGYVNFSRSLQTTTASTEAQFLLMRHVFDDLKYRRYEWKCDSLNAPSRKAATRLGFTYEGTFRQAVVYKGRNRDTAWFALLDRDWPRVRAAFQEWLDPTNFDADGRQRSRLRIAGADGADG